MLLLATVLYNVLFVATVSVAGMGLKNYVRAVELDANVGVAPSSVRDPAVHGRRERPGEGSIALLMVLGAKVLELSSDWTSKKPDGPPRRRYRHAAPSIS